MPDGTGMEVMRSARQSSPGTAVILLTAYGSVPDAVSAMRDGALDYLTKPISFDQLQATAAQVMHRAKQIAAAGPIAGRARHSACRQPGCVRAGAEFRQHGGATERHS